jgi:thioredoxin reductase (NADPH)
MNTTEVENFPGFPDGIMGPDLMQNMMKQAEKFGAEMLYDNVTSVDFNDKIKKVYVGEKEFLTKSVIIALGSSPRRLNVPGEEEFYGRGVSVCATCDASFYKDKVVAVVGGGDSAMEDALALTKFATVIKLVIDCCANGIDPSGCD